MTLEQLIEATRDRKLSRRMKKRVEIWDFRVCAAHDLAPIFEEALVIKPKVLQKYQSFLTTLLRTGLDTQMPDASVQ